MDKVKNVSITELADRIQKQDNLNKLYYENKIGPGGAYHRYFIARNKEYKPGQPIETLCDLQFQEGPRNEAGAVSGVVEGDLLEIVRHRLQCFQSGPYATRDNAIALTHIEEALLWLNKRKEDRKYRKVLGTTKK